MAVPRPTRIESIGIKNYRVFRDVVFRDLPRMAVLIGANGTGKSTLFDVFAFLKDALARNVAEAVDRRGGFDELVSRDSTGPVELMLKFRESGGSLVTYKLQIGADNGRAVVNRETLSYRRGRRGWPEDFVDFRQGVGRAVAQESSDEPERTFEQWERHELNDSSALAIKALGQFRKYRMVSELYNLIENCYISEFDSANARYSVENRRAEHLSSRGDNLTQVAKYLRENHADEFRRILDAMRRRVPGVRNAEAKATEDGRLVLRFQDGSFSDPFIARNVSDGTIKIFAYLVLLYDPKPHPLLAIEEPENYLYPDVLQELAEEFRAYAGRGGQVLLSTHSHEFLNGVELGEIFLLEKRDGFSKVMRASESELLRSLATEAQSGYMWGHNWFEREGLPWVG